MVGKGRKKVEMSLIKEPSSRMVCFSKRRKGLFKKAAELSILSGAKIAVLAFSQAGKLYCSDTEIMDSLLLPPKLDNSSEKQTEHEHASDSSFAGATAEQPFSSDDPTATADSSLCPALNISTENYAFTEAMNANLCCSQAAAALCPQLDNYREQEERNYGGLDFAAAAMAAGSFQCPRFEMPLENNSDYSFAGAMVAPPFSSDVPTANSSSLLCSPFDISTENDAALNPRLCSQSGIPSEYAFDPSFAGAMIEQPFSSDLLISNTLLYPQHSISTVNDAEPNGSIYDITDHAMAGNMYYSGDAAALNPLLRPQFDIPSVGAMAEEPFFSTVQNDDAGDDNGGNYAFPEAMNENLYYNSGDAAALNPLFRPQFDVAAAAVQEEDKGCWESDFAKAMAGKELPFWFDRTNVQAMGFEELRRLERAIEDYGQLQFIKNLLEIN